MGGSSRSLWRVKDPRVRRLPTAVWMEGRGRGSGDWYSARFKTRNGRRSRSTRRRPVADLATGCTTPTPAAVGEGEGAKDTVRVVFLVDHVMSIEAQRFQDGSRCLGLSLSLAGIHFEAVGEHEPPDEPLSVPKEMTRWVPQQEVLGFWLGNEVLTISLPQRKVGGIIERLAAWPPDDRRPRLQRRWYLPGRYTTPLTSSGQRGYFVRRLLQLSGLRLNGEVLGGGGHA